MTTAATTPFNIDAAHTYTLADAADILQVHRTTIYRWVRLGVLRAHRKGVRGVVVTGSDLLQAVRPL